VVPTETAFRVQTPGHTGQTRGPPRGTAGLQADINQASPARMLIEPVVPALDIVVGPDGRLECRPTAGWPQPATDPCFIDVCYTHGREVQKPVHATIVITCEAMDDQ